MRRSAENRMLAAHGFHQADKSCVEASPCDVCEKNVRGNRSWWKRYDPEYYEYDCYCRRCALRKVKAFEQ